MKINGTQCRPWHSLCFDGAGLCSAACLCTCAFLVGRFLASSSSTFSATQPTSAHSLRQGPGSRRTLLGLLGTARGRPGLCPCPYPPLTACTSSTSLEPQSPPPLRPTAGVPGGTGGHCSGLRLLRCFPTTTSQPRLHPGCALTSPSRSHVLLPSPSQPLGSGFDPCPNAGQLYSKASCLHFL